MVALGTGVGGALKSGALLVEKVTAKVVKVEAAGAKGPGTSIVPRQGSISFENGKTFESLSVSEQQGLNAIQKLGYDVHVPLEASKKAYLVCLSLNSMFRGLERWMCMRQII
ncbi:hypothetical protein BK648_12385 [Pseudomonas poae]|uniref:Uncharacterized protein n=1 Tax=Pseudomonas poae TaxID=200451 RepID=A0A423F5P5_9PSED|nr:hypothetical protein BK648_12385 [Pseudomonas poae]